MEEELGLEQLKSVYKAQTEAYLEFNMALINILSNQKELLNKVESLKVLSEDEFRDLSEDYHALEALFVNFQNTQIPNQFEGSGCYKKSVLQHCNFPIHRCIYDGFYTM